MGLLWVIWSLFWLCSGWSDPPRPLDATTDSLRLVMMAGGQPTTTTSTLAPPPLPSASSPPFFSFGQLLPHQPSVSQLSRDNPFLACSVSGVAPVTARRRPREEEVLPEEVPAAQRRRVSFQSEPSTECADIPFVGSRAETLRAESERLSPQSRGVPDEGRDSVGSDDSSSLVSDDEEDDDETGQPRQRSYSIREARGISRGAPTPWGLPSFWAEGDLATPATERTPRLPDIADGAESAARLREHEDAPEVARSLLTLGCQQGRGMRRSYATTLFRGGPEAELARRRRTRDAQGRYPRGNVDREERGLMTRWIALRERMPSAAPMTPLGVRALLPSPQPWPSNHTEFFQNIPEDVSQDISLRAANFSHPELAIPLLESFWLARPPRSSGSRRVRGLRSHCGLHGSEDAHGTRGVAPRRHRRLHAHQIC